MDDTQLTYIKEVACKAIENAAEDLHSISKTIWENPELHYNEHKAHKLLTDYLEDQEFQVDREYHLATAFRAVHGNSDDGQPNVAIICEYDALPGLGHACGHNLIAEVGIGASLGVKAAMETSDVCFGTLTVLGTPAEETGGGKIDLIQAGAFDGLDAAMMAHPGAITAAATKILAMTEVHVTYIGKASQAAGSPWEGINALDAAVLAYNNLSCLRQQIKSTWRLHGVITDGGDIPSIIPDKAKLHFYLRTPTEGELTSLCDKARACFEAAATATGCQVNFEWDPKPFSNMLPNKTLASMYESNCGLLSVPLCEDQAVLSQATGSTDMGNVSHVLPALHPHFYIATSHAAHTRQFRDAAGSRKAQRYTLQQAKALAMTALDVFCRPKIVQRMERELRDDLREDGEG